MRAHDTKRAVFPSGVETRRSVPAAAVAAWSARVRYAGPVLKEQLATAGEAVAGKVRVRAGRGKPPANSDQ